MVQALWKVFVEEDAIVGSMGVASKPVPAGTIVGGIPAKAIKTKSIAPEDLRAAAELGYRVKLLGVAVEYGTALGNRIPRAIVRFEVNLRDRRQRGGSGERKFEFARGTGQRLLPVARPRCRGRPRHLRDRGPRGGVAGRGVALNCRAGLATSPS